MMKAAIAILILPLLAPVAAQAAPTESEQRFACMGDAMRLCPQHIPNRDAIIQCMATQRAALSAGCRPVFDASYRALMERTRH